MTIFITPELLSNNNVCHVNFVILFNIMKYVPVNQNMLSMYNIVIMFTPVTGLAMACIRALARQ